MSNDYHRIIRKKKMMRMAASIYRKFSGLPLKVVKFLGKNIIGDANLAANMMIPYAQAMEAACDYYVTYDFHPKKSSDLNVWEYYSGEKSNKCCIVMQGPLRLEENFTLETVRFYGRVCPDVLVIISTWEDEDADTVALLKAEENCIVVQNALPEKSGDGNINYQRLSSYYGVLEAINQRKEYVLKTRTDTRITMPGIVDNLMTMLELFPLDDVSGVQNKRIIIFNAYAFLPFNESGTFYFGNSYDLKVMFSDESMAQNKYNGKYDGNLFLADKVTYRQLFKKGSSLMDFTKKFFAKMDEKIECDIENWWDIVGRRTICLPIAYLRPLWVKYDFNHENSDFLWLYRRNIMGSTGLDNTMINFAMWNDLRCKKCNLDPKNYLHLLDDALL